MLIFNPERRQVTAETAGVIVDLLIGPAQVMHLAGDLTAAESAYRALREAYPEHPKPMHELGVLLVQRGDVDEGMELLIDAVSHDHLVADWHHDLGCALIEHHRRYDLTLSQVQTHFHRALRLNANHLYAHVNLSQIHETQGDVDSALHWMSRASVLDPGAGQWVIRRSELLLQMSRAEEAELLCSTWLKRHGPSALMEHYLQAQTGKGVSSRASDEYVTQVFDNYAVTFDSHLALLDYQAPRHVGETMARYRGSSLASLDILDAGCGTGLCAPHVRPMARRLVGIDLSPRMLDRARMRGGYDELHASELMSYAQAHALEFDVIICADTLCYFGDLTAALEAFYAALRPGGILVFTLEQQLQDNAAYTLGKSGRYQHPRSYVDHVLQCSDWKHIDVSAVHLRNERQQSVAGWLVCAHK